jgi:hypothetical protein
VRWLFPVLLAACWSQAPKTNEIVGKNGRKEAWRVKVASATFCPTCGTAAVTTVTFGTPAKVVLLIPTCYAHAHSKVGDRDKISIERVDDHAMATAGQLDIADCLSTHLTAQLSATFPDGQSVAADIDTEIVPP